MNKTKIPWADYTINPVKGLCPMACEYCYARRMYKRYKWDETIRFEPSVFNDIPKMKAGSKVFVGSTMELFGEWIDPAWMMMTFERVRAHPELIFIFLTKQPQNLIKWSPFPENCWVGMTVDKMSRYGDITDTFASIKATVKFVSFEPMIDYTPPDLRYVDWIILGSKTQPTQHPPREWVDEIIAASGRAKIPVFVKSPMASHYGIYRQEYPVQV